MEILTEDQHRALAFIEACNSQGHFPTDSDVERWLAEPAQPVPRGAVLGATHSLFRVLYGFQGSVTDQLVRLRWVTEAAGRLFTEDLGRALLQDAEAKTAEVMSSTTVVLGSDNPLAYATLMSELAAAGAGLLVDPYIRREQLLHVVQDTTLSRLLISQKIGPRDLASVRSFLGYIPAGRELEVRVASEAHDRYLKGEDGRVFIGGSMGMVSLQKATTVFTPVPEDSREMIGKMLEDQWAAAEALRAEAVEAGKAADDADEETQSSTSTSSTGS
jgi:hypothetical protein